MLRRSETFVTDGILLSCPDGSQMNSYLTTLMVDTTG